MSNDAVLQVSPLGFPWETIDPFLFCVYHDDAYPKGDGAFGPRPRWPADRWAPTSPARTAGGCTTA